MQKTLSKLNHLTFGQYNSNTIHFAASRPREKMASSSNNSNNTSKSNWPCSTSDVRASKWNLFCSHSLVNNRQTWLPTAIYNKCVCNWPKVNAHTNTLIRASLSKSYHKRWKKSIESSLKAACCCLGALTWKQNWPREHSNWIFGRSVKRCNGHALVI